MCLNLVWQRVCTDHFFLHNDDDDDDDDDDLCGFLIRDVFAQKLLFAKTTVKVNKFYHLHVNRKTAKNVHTLCLCILLCSGDPVCSRATTTATALVQSGLSMCNVLAMRRH